MTSAPSPPEPVGAAMTPAPGSSSAAPPDATSPNPPAAAPTPVPSDAVPPYPPGYAFAPARPDRLTRLFQRFWYGPPVWAAPAALLVCMGSAVAYTQMSAPTSAAAGDAPNCLLKYTTGFVCPGCGGTRAAFYLLHGDLPAAARHHALFVIAVPFLLYLYVAWAGKRVFGWQLPPFSLTPRIIGVFLAAWGVWSVARNLPWAPFTSFYV